MVTTGKTCFNRHLTFIQRHTVKTVSLSFNKTAARPSTSLAWEVGTNLAYPAGSMPSRSLLSFPLSSVVVFFFHKLYQLQTGPQTRN